MDDLVNLMRLIDLNSEIISEGHYLEMCNSIKNVHETISQLNSKYDSESESDDDTQNFYTLERRNDSNTILEPFTPPIPFLADGGTLRSGQLGIAGEAGPELISGPATVTPMDQIGGANPQVNITIQAIDTQTGTEFLLKNKKQIEGIIQHAYNRRGKQGIY